MRIFSSLSTVFAVVLVQPAFADATRHLGAHEHGVGQLNIAIDAGQVALEFTAPGADIVGFEYPAERKADLDAVEAAIATLSNPLSLFQLPEGAQCELQEAVATVRAEAHDHHDAQDDHADHAEQSEDHAHEEHAHEHGEHDHDHGEHEHDHDHGEHETAHSEFHAQYLLSCAKPQALTGITFDYFSQFPNAREVEVQVISDTGAHAFEVEHDSPHLDLTGAL